MPKNPQFSKLLEEMRAIHEKKNDDYSSTGPYENFERAAIISGWFDDDIDKVFATLISIKLARLAVLSNQTKAPNNESIADTFLDLTVYCGLWGSYRREARELDVARSDTFEYKGPKYNCKMCGVEFIGPPTIVKFRDSTSGLGNEYYFCNVLHKEDYIESCIRNHGARYNVTDNILRY